MDGYERYEQDLMEMEEEAKTLGKLKGEVRIALEVMDEGTSEAHLHLVMIYMTAEDLGYVMQEDCLADQEE